VSSPNPNPNPNPTNHPDPTKANPNPNPNQVAKDLNVKIFTAEIIYHLFDKFTAYMADVRKAQQEKASLLAVYPCVAET
jgi:translation initiation factor IF-2